jgi:Tfp pilus assembly protein PilF
VVWRNLGIGYFNVQSDVALARSAFDRAIQADPKDARVLYERDSIVEAGWRNARPAACRA